MNSINSMELTKKQILALASAGENLAVSRGEIATTPPAHTSTWPRLNELAMAKHDLANCIICERVMEKLRKQIQICQTCLGNE